MTDDRTTNTLPLPPWSIEVDAGVYQINDAAGAWVCECINAAAAAHIVNAINSSAPSSTKVIEKTDYDRLRDCYAKIDKQTALIETMREALETLLLNYGAVLESHGETDQRSMQIARAALAQASPPSQETV